VFANNLLPFSLRKIEAEKTPGAVVRIDDDTPISLDIVNDIQKSARKMQIEHHWKLGDTVIIDND
jgi:hypothetical protein